MKVGVVTSGRFHVSDLARELDALGHEVRFYSLVPASRLARFGLPARCARWLGPRPTLLYQLASRSRGRRLRSILARLATQAVDAAAAERIEPCDVLIGMSGMCGLAMEMARSRFGARCVLERGSRHIESQHEILGQLGTAGVPDWAVKRELADYAAADVISVPSRQAVESFVERGVPAEKMFLDPYGVSLDMFPITPAPPPEPRVIVTAGAWSMQKGSDLLARAWEGLEGVSLLHVGPVVDVPLPTRPGFVHHDAVEQRLLSSFYAMGHVFALPSRQDGFGMVAAQALASGLRLVCSDRTGGPDLAELSGNPRAVEVVAAGDVPALQRALSIQLERAAADPGRDLLGPARSRLTWQAYGKRYETMLLGL